MNIPASPTFTKTIQIDAPVSTVWAALTKTELMKKWMSEDDIDILTDWQVGSPFIIRGNLHGIKFENKGLVLQFEPERVLSYSHLSSISRLRYQPENYAVLYFQVASTGTQTSLTLTVSNFPTESIYKHMAFYWNVTLEIFKRLLEQTE